jgi:predicted amidohydrolase
MIVFRGDDRTRYSEVGMSFNAAVVQTATIFGPGARDANLASARRYAGEAARRGAHIVCFPETYPGAWTMPVDWVPLPELRAIARDCGIFLIGGYAEPLDGEGRRCHNAVALVDPDCKVVGIYRRTTPAHAPWIYKGGKWLWDFEWVPADDLPVFETELGTIGLLICSEVYAPELARILALKGAEILFLPMGFMGTKAGIRETWRTLMWARAIENLAYTAVSSNILPGDDRGLAMVCSPEEIVLEASDEGSISRRSISTGFGGFETSRIASSTSRSRGGRSPERSGIGGARRSSTRIPSLLVWS